jgi:putative MFS transporter
MMSGGMGWGSLPVLGRYAAARVQAASPSEPDTSASASRDAARRRNPWWIPIWLGRAPELDAASQRMLGLVVLGSFFEAYDLSLLTSALKHISEDLDIGAEQIGYYLGAVRLGGFLAFGLLPFTDRFGRRPLFLLSLIGMSVLTLATAFAQTPLQFVACQILSRAFMLTAAAVGVVMLTEELPAEHRGWGIGILGALAAFGHGLGALLFAFVDVLPFGWRALYAIGAAPLIAFPYFRRSLRETARFAEHQAQRNASPGTSGLIAWAQPILALLRAHPGRALGVGGAGMLLALGAISVFAFSAYFLQTVHHWEPWQYSTMLLTAGGVGVVGNVVAGNLGDRLGRRVVGFFALALYPVAAIAFYQGSGWVLPLAFGAIVFTSSAADVVIGALSAELFPTSQRGASSALLTLVRTIGWIAGLWLVSGGMASQGDLPRVISGLAAVVGIAAFCVLLLPESGRRELESLSSET